MFFAMLSACHNHGNIEATSKLRKTKHSVRRNQHKGILCTEGLSLLWRAILAYVRMIVADALALQDISNNRAESGGGVHKSYFTSHNH